MVLGVPCMTDLMSDTTGTSEGESYTCGICGKKFDRRDLRNRHKRRCVRSISNPRQSKQKSCYSCAASKVSCDQKLPSCARCTIRKVSCEYAFSSGIRERKRPAGDAENISDALDQAMLAQENSTARGKDARACTHSSVHTHLTVDDVQAEISPLSSDRRSEDMTGSSVPAPNNQFADSPRPGRTINSSIAQSSAILSSHVGNEGSARTWANTENMQHFLDSDMALEEAPAETGTMALSPAGQLSIAQHVFPVNDMSALSDGYNIQWVESNLADFQPTSEHGWRTYLSNFSIESSSDFSLDLMGPSSIPGTHTLTNAFQWVSPQCPVSVFNTPSCETHDFADMAAEEKLSSVRRNPPSRITPVDPIYIGIDAQDRDLQVSEFDQGGEFTSHPVHTVSYQVNSSEIHIKMLLEFPQMMARSGREYPPFVHHKLYRCEEGDVLKPLAVAFCCVTALNAAFPSGKDFVHSLMNAERDRLLKGFRLMRDSELEMIAVVHVMCVYQIIGFFDDSSPDSARFAELQQPFFLRMARRLAGSYMPQLRYSYYSSDFSELAWGKWTCTETVRRTLFLIHIINVMACRAEKQNSYFFEELNDDLIMDLPLPSPEKVWKANSAAEWKSAIKEELQGGWQANVTARMALSGNRSRENNADGSKWDFSGDSILLGVRAGRGFPVVHLASSHDFTSLLIDCIDRR